MVRSWAALKLRQSQFREKYTETSYIKLYAVLIEPWMVYCTLATRGCCSTPSTPPFCGPGIHSQMLLSVFFSLICLLHFADVEVEAWAHLNDLNCWLVPSMAMVNMCTICWASFIFYTVNSVLIHFHFSLQQSLQEHRRGLPVSTLHIRSVQIVRMFLFSSPS